MAQNALTDAMLKQLKPGENATKHFDGGGLYLELTPAGKKYWRIKYRFAGKENRISLGVYPGVGLKAARAARDETRKLLASGTDPSQERKLAKAMSTIAASNTFEAVAREWHTVKSSGWSPNHAETTMERMVLNLFPWLGGRPLIELKPPEVLITLRRIEARGKIETAHRCRSIASQIFDYAIVTGRAESNPASALGAALKKSVGASHLAITDPVRFGQLLRDIDTYSGSPTTRAVLQIGALTFQRPGEVSGMAWSELDLDVAMWTVPGERMKRTLTGKSNGKPHHVPLSKQAIEVIKDLQPFTGRSALVFPSERGQGRGISDNTARQAIHTMGYADHTPHGFRATARTLARQELHFKPEVIERAMAHGSDEELGSAYDRAEYLADRIVLMQQWADYLDRLRKR